MLLLSTILCLTACFVVLATKNSRDTNSTGVLHRFLYVDASSDVGIHRNSLVDMNVLKKTVKQRGYKHQFPFPHIVFDDIFPVDLMNAIEKEISAEQILDENCGKGKTKCYHDLENRARTYSIDSDLWLGGSSTASLIAFLKSSHFVHFLESMTGIQNIIPNPQSQAGGIQQVLSGGFLRLHADSNKNIRYDLHRRVNVIIYLNRDWKDEYGGHLELWHRNLRQCGAMIRPILGRMVIFSSTDFSYHGFPNFMQLPVNVSRKSISMSYYTSTRPSYECSWWTCAPQQPQILWQTASCAHCDDRNCKSFAHIV